MVSWRGARISLSQESTFPLVFVLFLCRFRVRPIFSASPERDMPERAGKRCRARRGEIVRDPQWRDGRVSVGATDVAQEESMRRAWPSFWTACRRPTAVMGER